MNKDSGASFTVLLGMILVMTGLAMPIVTGSFDTDTFRYIYAAGALLSLLGRLFTPPYRGNNLRLRRLLRLQSWSAIFYCVAAFFTFYDKTTLRDWIAFTLAGAAVQIIASVMVTLQLRKKGN